MQVFQYHVFVCDQQKAEGLPSCGARGGAAVIDALRAEIGRQGLGEAVQVTMCGSLGLCERGPNMVVYPEGTWYSGVQPGDAAELVDSHFRRGQVVERLRNRDADAVRAEIGGNRLRFVTSVREKDASGTLPDPLQQTIRGFQESRAVLTAIELDIFSAVGAGATADAVAAAIAADRRATGMLLNALAAMRLVDKHGETFSNTPLAARYLAAGGTDDSRAAVMHTVHLWNTWSRLTEAVRTGTAPPRADPAERGDQWTEAFIAAMDKNAAGRAAAVVRAAAADGARRMLDIGGGSGAYAIAFAKAHPDLRVDILDVPAVTPIAERHIAAAQLTDRVHTRTGDMTTAALGEHYDIILLSAICHMFDADQNRDLLKRCCGATAPDGRLVIQDFILDASKTAPKSGALFALNMLVGTRGGSAYSAQEYDGWLREAGFAEVRHVGMPGPTGLMIGIRR